MWEAEAGSEYKAAMRHRYANEVNWKHVMA